MLTFFQFDPTYWTVLRTTNPIERMSGFLLGESLSFRLVLKTPFTAIGPSQTFCRAPNIALEGQTHMVNAKVQTPILVEFFNGENSHQEFPLGAASLAVK